MEALTREFASTIARTALADIEGALDRALKREITHGQRSALVNLRQRSVSALDGIAKGRDPRLPAAVVDEVASGIHAILHPDSKQAIVKRASGPGNRNEAGLLLEPEGKAKTDALTALAKEFAELAAKAEKACKNLGADLAFSAWRGKFRRNLMEFLRVGDFKAAQEEMATARRALSALLDEAKRRNALGR